jgi:hypothetical protein
MPFARGQTGAGDGGMSNLTAKLQIGNLRTSQRLLECAWSAAMTAGDNLDHLMTAVSHSTARVLCSPAVLPQSNK